MKKPCFCGAIIAVLIIVFTWLYTPEWANYAVIVLAALLLIGSLSGGCKCGKKCDHKDDHQAPPETPPAA